MLFEFVIAMEWFHHGLFVVGAFWAAYSCRWAAAAFYALLLGRVNGRRLRGHLLGRADGRLLRYGFAAVCCSA